MPAATRSTRALPSVDLAIRPLDQPGGVMRRQAVASFSLSHHRTYGSRIRRFGGLILSHSQLWKSERGEVNIGPRVVESWRIRRPPWAVSAARRLRG